MFHLELFSVIIGDLPLLVIESDGLAHTAHLKWLGSYAVNVDHSATIDIYCGCRHIVGMCLVISLITVTTERGNNTA